MSVEGRNEGVESYRAAADLSGRQYLGMTITSDHTVNVPAAANDLCAGVLQNKPAAAGRGAKVKLGRTKVRAGGTLTAGDFITMAASGYFIKALSGYRQHGAVIFGAASGYIATAEITLGGPIAVTSLEAGQV